MPEAGLTLTAPGEAERICMAGKYGCKHDKNTIGPHTPAAKSQQREQQQSLSACARARCVRATVSSLPPLQLSSLHLCTVSPTSSRSVYTKGTCLFRWSPSFHTLPPVSMETTLQCPLFFVPKFQVVRTTDSPRTVAPPRHSGDKGRGMSRPGLAAVPRACRTRFSCRDRGQGSWVVVSTRTRMGLGAAER